MEHVQFALSILAHFLIGLYFVFFGSWNIYHWASMTQIMIERNLPSPFLLLSLIIALQIMAGIMLMFSLFVKLVAVVLVPFVIVFIFILHPFWKFKGEVRKQHMALFITNCTMCLGALLLLIK